MGKVQILAVLTMDGCHASELYSKADKDFCLDHCGINEIRENALYHITPDYSISMLDEWRKDQTDICYLAETMPDNADYINGLLRMRVVDEIILYTVPFISGTGRHFFKSAMPQTHWTLTSHENYPNGISRNIYTLTEGLK
ncbi:dihydrofolate reductase family protein [Bacteroides uniformis]|uniref:dihydrofolate reductase family protein n=1 Tax=Bacteroides uniformis TaxID=820 RepID=UPI001D08D5C8|nr:dihydrofolate reductase family protein [Bacteroides uniformis]MCB6981286.1 dihydrofolate reductase family protein [Bacteroides uniformis]MCB7029477.1 dihydrofolate reductase family protein [Bacteroides uniformis]